MPTIVRYLLQRFAILVGLLLAVSMITFAAMNTLGDPLFNILGFVAECDEALAQQAEGGTGSASIQTDDGQTIFCEDFDNNGQDDRVEEAKEQYYLDRALPVRYGLWLKDAVQGDFGTSFANQGDDVTEIVREKLPITIALATYAQFIAVALAIPWGVWAASRAGKLTDRVSTTTSFGLISLPNFALGIILYYIFLVRLEWFPFYNEADGEGAWEELKALTIPAITLALPIAAAYQRLLRTDLITTLQDDFILMARAKGVPRRRVLFGHALRPSMFSFITIFGINAGALIGGTLVIESIFLIPGAGSEIVSAVLREDFPVVLAFVVIITAAFVILNMLVDLFYTVLDPRVRG